MTPHRPPRNDRSLANAPDARRDQRLACRHSTAFLTMVTARTSRCIGGQHMHYCVCACSHM
eukprot:12939963-Alexandrium_andersonii.AAC.1